RGRSKSSRPSTSLAILWMGIQLLPDGGVLRRTMGLRLLLFLVVWGLVTSSKGPDRCTLAINDKSRLRGSTLLGPVGRARPPKDPSPWLRPCSAPSTRRAKRRASGRRDSARLAQVRNTSV